MTGYRRIIRRGLLASLREMHQAQSCRLRKQCPYLLGMQLLHERPDETLFNSSTTAAERTLCMSILHMGAMTPSSPPSIEERLTLRNSAINKSESVILMLQFLHDFCQDFAVDQTKPESVAALCQVPGMQGTETPRPDKFMAVLNIATSFILPAINKEF
jgi:hypothetical protein